MEKIELKKLKTWFLDQRRDFPWRDQATPYMVWVSEVMLQQTQAATVLPYFERWMKRFPSIYDLANASLDEVIKEWEGLGYYSRVRNLHEGAKYVVENHAGKLPASPEELQKIKGLGPYTIGAILSFAFHKRYAAVDANVLRVFARYYNLQDNISQPKSIKKIQSMVEAILPEGESWVVMEALIELGATICGRKPKCWECPLRITCDGFAQGSPESLPVKGPKAATTPLYRAVSVIYHRDCFLVKRELKGKIMAGLYEFPYFELENPEVDAASLCNKVLKELQIETEWQKSLPEVRHSFTRYRALLLPHCFAAKASVQVKGYEWLSVDTLSNLAFSSGHRKIFSLVRNH